MKLVKQLKTLDWATPVVVSLGEEQLFQGTAKEAVRSPQLLNYMDVSLKNVKLVPEVASPHLDLILINKK